MATMAAAAEAAGMTAVAAAAITGSGF